MFSSNMVFVSEDEARSYYVPPNTKMLLMDKEKPQFYVKATDTLGQYIIDTYTFKKVEPIQQITRDDLDAFKREILALLPTTTNATITPQEDTSQNAKSTTNTEW